MTRLSDVVYKLKKTGPRTVPCEIYLEHELEQDMLIIWYWFDKYEQNHRRVVRNACVNVAKELPEQLYQTQQKDPAR